MTCKVEGRKEGKRSDRKLKGEVKFKIRRGAKGNGQGVKIKGGANVRLEGKMKV